MKSRDRGTPTADCQLPLPNANRHRLTPVERARRAAVRERARRAEERRAIIREAMSLIGSATTPAKRRAARKNGKQGGRPRLSPGANTKDHRTDQALPEARVMRPNASGEGRP